MKFGLQKGQKSQVWLHDIRDGSNTLLYETDAMFIEAPNWAMQGDRLIVNGNGVLWNLPLDNPTPNEIKITGVPRLNNDHVLDPDGKHIFISGSDTWRIYHAPLAGGAARCITDKEGPPDLLHFLHGVSPDGKELAFVGVHMDRTLHVLKFISMEIYTVASNGSKLRRITTSGKPADGPEYSPDGKWLYINTEAFSPNAQIARMRPDGSDMERLTFTDTVDWFPHVSPDGKIFVYLCYPPGTAGHPGDLWVELKVVRNGDWKNPTRAARFFGGQGTINVNSWSPDSTRFAYVTYPME